MAHYAKVIDGVVKSVIVAEEEIIQSGLVGDPSIWVQTSYNTKGGVHYEPDSAAPSQDQTKALRKNYACIGGTYDLERDAFISERPFPSWVLNEQTCLWDAPVDKPDDGNFYSWNEEGLEWQLDVA